MGRDEHNHSKGKRSRLAQTPKYEIQSDGRDIEFSEEFADHDDKEAQMRSQSADKRAKRK
ncbi:YfhD family protein [Virgibacillus ndiopensis]|uniref:YfhD family protein n=1 Tax=Virgibacillus ndiopensis TaxID=2004408 RepID=UPI000C07B385|nr:YfhD family protein [Virgibacillus ndiopensis]